MPGAILDSACAGPKGEPGDGANNPQAAIYRRAGSPGRRRLSRLARSQVMPLQSSKEHKVNGMTSTPICSPHPNPLPQGRGSSVQALFYGDPSARRARENSSGGSRIVTLNLTLHFRMLVTFLVMQVNLKLVESNIDIVFTARRSMERFSSSTV